MAKVYSEQKISGNLRGHGKDHGQALNFQCVVFLLEELQTRINYVRVKKNASIDLDFLGHKGFQYWTRHANMGGNQRVCGILLP